jgi:hypothetical protein
MPQVFTDNTGSRVIIRHKGPAGAGLPPGGTTGQIYVKASNDDFDGEWANSPAGTGAAVGPASSVNGNFALFDGTTGKLLKDSGRALSYFASVSLVETKVDAVDGKGLSTEDFTTEEKDKLATISASGFRGSYTLVDDIEDITTPVEGDYALLEEVGEPIRLFLRDETNGVWTDFASDPVTMSGAEIADVLFDNGGDWVKDTCEIYTTTEKGQLASHEAIINALNLGAAAAPAYGSVSYFNLTGTSVTLTGTSDGTTNTYKINVATALSSAVLGFDNGGANNARLRYTGTASATFLVTANLSLEGATTADFVVSLAKNGATISEGRGLTAINTNNDVENVSISLVVTLLNNEYLELFLGRTSGSLDPVVHALSITAVKIA